MRKLYSAISEYSMSDLTPKSFLGLSNRYFIKNEERERERERQRDRETERERDATVNTVSSNKVIICGHEYLQ